MQVIFGPVNSRRFGTSLGIDLSPQTKQCNFDCLYCELAPAQPLQQQNYVVPLETILKELRKHLDDSVDVITVTANGEPTLYPYLDELVLELNALPHRAKSLILTNSASLTSPKSFATLLKFDKVKLSLDAATQRTFKKIDRPAQGIQIEDIIQAMQRFSQEFGGVLFIEVLFVKGVNDSADEVEALNRALLGLKNITRVDIGTIDRPPAYPVEPLSYKELHDIALHFDSMLPLNIVSRGAQRNFAQHDYSKEEILNTLDKRPLSMDDMKALFSHRALQNLKELLEEGSVTLKRAGGLEFYLPTANLERKRAKKS